MNLFLLKIVLLFCCLKSYSNLFFIFQLYTNEILKFNVILKLGYLSFISSLRDMILVSNLLLLFVIGSKAKSFNNLGGPRKFSTKDGGMASISSMTEHQYLGKEYRTYL